MARPHPILWSFPLVCAFVLASCGTPRSADSEPTQAVEPSAPLPWTTRFVDAGWVVAQNIELEGPNGLLLHVAATQNPAEFRYRTEAVEGALRQVWERSSPGSSLLRVQLDKWELHASERVVIVERLSEVPVTLRATGDVSWSDAQGGGPNAKQGSGAARHVVQGFRPTQP